MLPRVFKNIVSLFRVKTIASLVFVFAIVFLFLSLPDIAFAQNEDVLGINQAGENLALAGTDIRVIIARIINVILGLLAVILVGLMVYAGFLWMTSAGKEDQVAKAKKVLINAIIGLLIVLSSWAITRFLLGRLQQAIGGAGDGGGGRPPAESFIASGSLGRIIKDHYPFRNQTGVKRNTKIVVTFAEPIDPGSIIRNTNNSCWTDNGFSADPAVCDPNGDGELDLPAYYGDCVDNNGQQVCDELATSSVQIAPSADDQAIQEAYAFTTYDNNARADTFVFLPKQALGSDEENVRYTVVLTNNILLQNGGGVFAGDRDSRYEWEFETDTEFDVDPPYVLSVYPRNDQVVPRNSIVKVTFNEAIDPTAVQGIVGPDSLFNNIIFNAAVDVQGEWRLSNGYRTVEFVSNIACGQNSCGDPIYCLPIACNNPQDAACQNDYNTLLRTALKMNPDNPNSFESIPFTGVADMSGNRLDGNDDDVAQIRPPVNDPKIIDEAEQAPDNYWWSFAVQNTIDRSPPHIESVSPPLDQERVDAFVPVEIEFSKEMWNQTLYDIAITEFPEQLRDELGLPPIWKRVRADDINGKSISTLDHREFGPLGENFYYFVSVPGSVKSVTQNCLYPGRGPHYEEVGNGEQVPRCEIQYDERGNAIGEGNNCVPVNVLNPDQDTACARRINRADDSLLQADMDSCINFLSKPQISPR